MDLQLEGGLQLLQLPLQLLHPGVGPPLLLLEELQPPPQLLPLLPHLAQVSLGLRPPVQGLRGGEEGVAGVVEAQLGLLPQVPLLLQEALQLPQLLPVVSLLLLTLVLLRDDAGAALRQLPLQGAKLRLLLRLLGRQALLQLLHLLFHLPPVRLEAGLHPGLLLAHGGQGGGEGAQLGPQLGQAALCVHAARGRGLMKPRLQLRLQRQRTR